MSVVRHFSRNTQTNAGTGGIVYDLSTATGTSTTLNSGSFSFDVFTEIFSWQIDVGNKVNSTSFPTSIEVTSVNNVTYRWVVRRVNSSNVVQATSTNVSSQTTTGVKTGTLTLSTTWAPGDRLRFSLEARRTTTMTTASISVGINRSTTFVDISLDPSSRRRIFFIT
jgi:hypothetical protein